MLGVCVLLCVCLCVSLSCCVCIQCVSRCVGMCWFVICLCRFLGVCLGWLGFGFDVIVVWFVYVCVRVGLYWCVCLTCFGS